MGVFEELMQTQKDYKAGKVSEEKFKEKLAQAAAKLKELGERIQQFGEEVSKENKS